ncbi:MAG: FkbM family methyltransferase [Candidatus Magasanikbacteria bacterium]
MEKHDRLALKQMVLERYELFKFNHSRVQRFLRDPWRTIKFYIMTAFSYIKPFKVKYRTLWGDTMVYYLPEGNQICYYGFFEADLTNFLINFLQDGDVFIDIGAHVGFYTVLASNLVGATGSVHSFEPTPRTFGSLRENARPHSNVCVNNFAVLDEEKTINFVDYGPRYSAYNSFRDRIATDVDFLKRGATPIMVKTIVLDHYCEVNNIKPSFVKIDAEGAEHLILDGMKNLLETARPVISIEAAGEEEWQVNCQKSIDLLLGHDYLPFELSIRGELSVHQVKDCYKYDNLIFIPREKAV